MPEFYQKMTKKELYEKWMFWQNRATEDGVSSEYYQTELAKAHELLGRVLHQTSERWDSVRLSKFFPTDNLHGKRTVGNASGKGK